MKRREKKSKINIFKYLSILLIILFVLSTPTVIKKLIKINKIECTSQFGQCTEQFSTGDYLFVKKQIEQSLKQNIQVNSYLIQYKIPSTIKIELVLKKPNYAISNLSHDFYLIDRSGVVLGIVKETEMPFLVADTNYVIGQKISDSNKFALDLLEKVKVINTISSAEIKDKVFEVRVENGVLVKFPLEGDVDVLVGGLRLIFSRLNDETNGIRMEDVTEIDLRFKNPVLR